MPKYEAFRNFAQPCITREIQAIYDCDDLVQRQNQLFYKGLIIYNDLSAEIKNCANLAKITEKDVKFFKNVTLISE